MTVALLLMPDWLFQISLARAGHEILHVWSLMNHWSIVLLEILTWAGTVLVLLFLNGDKFNSQPDEVRRKRIRRILSLVILLALLVNTFVIAIASHGQSWREAETRANYESKSAGRLWNAPKKATPGIVVLDHGISSVVEQMDVFVRNRFPQFEVKRISLHLLPQQDSSTVVWNIVQKGELERFSETLPYPKSLVGQSIKDGVRRHCPDISIVRSTKANCSDFSRPTVEIEYNYKSLLCIPIRGTNGAAGSIAGVCFYSAKPHAFDGGDQILEEALKPQLQDLALLLEPYRGVFTGALGASRQVENPPIASP